MRKLLVLFLMAVSITSLSAKVVLPDIIASHMVLQQCDSIKLWGHGSSGTVIKITPSWGQKTYKTVVNEKGEEIGLSLGFFDKTVPEEVAERWSLHCMKDGTLRIVEW